MKVFFSIIWLPLLTNSIFCQQTSVTPKTSNLLLNNKWELDKYVWSQSHKAIRKVEKPSLDYSVIDDWDYLDNSKISISPDGSYCAFKTYKGGMYYKRDEALKFTSITGNWQKSFSSKNSGFFSADSKQYIFKDKEDLNFLQLGSDQVRSVKQVISYKQSTKNATEWIAYQINNNEAELVLQNLFSGKEMKISQVVGYDFDQSGKWLACQLKSDQKDLLIQNLGSGGEKRIPFVESYAFSNNGASIVLKIATKGKIEIKYLTLSDGTINTIWSTTEKNISVNNFSLDESGKQVVFNLKNSSGNASDNSIWYYKVGMEKAEMKANNRAPGIKAVSSISVPTSFTEDGRYIQFELENVQISSIPASDAVMVDVWNHKDNILQSNHSISANISSSYKALINPQSGEIIRLEKEKEKVYLLKGDFVIIQKSGQVQNDRFWEIKNKQDSIWLVSLKNGARQLLPITQAFSADIFFSPQEKYLLYLDPKDRCHYYSIELATGKKIKISIGIPDWRLGHEDRFMNPIEKPTRGCGIAGWLKNDSAVLVYDDYDIWQLDLTGKKVPISITLGYGRKNNVLLSLLNNDRMRNSNLAFHPNDTLLLAAFNKKNRYSGFYRLVLGTQRVPELLSMGPFFYLRLAGIERTYRSGMKPIHIPGSNNWIVQRESTIEAPNYFMTKDFKTFKPLTQFQSHKDYNWVRSELHSFKQLDGTISQGVLYKPENFDPSKKYPVIISFYTQCSDALNQFANPSYIESAELIGDQAWMVSQGYLVFFPDIYFTKGQWGPSVKNTVVGAANFLSQLSYVDSKRLGACGHSNGGRMGYYLFTHSNCFAAMSVSSGTTDIISNGLKMNPEDGTSSLSWAEEGFPNGGLGELWKNKTTWLDHASVLHADKVTCPLLIFQSKKDPAYLQAFELFTSLRRLGKKAWWLQYDKGGHRINDFGENPNEMKDYTIRYTQFWDHFLKGAPAPRWMTQGIPVAVKGIEARYELDPSGTCSLNDDCHICNAWNEQYKKHPELFTKPICEWRLNP